jgi:hypothetical protein
MEPLRSPEEQRRHEQIERTRMSERAYDERTRTGLRNRAESGDPNAVRAYEARNQRKKDWYNENKSTGSQRQRAPESSRRVEQRQATPESSRRAEERRRTPESSRRSERERTPLDVPADRDDHRYHAGYARRHGRDTTADIDEELDRQRAMDEEMGIEVDYSKDPYYYPYYHR